MIESNVDLKIPTYATQLAWALELRKMGMAIIPTYPQSKIPAIKWKHFSGFLTEEEIHQHWANHPDHESAILPGEDLVVLDADSKQAIMALTSLEYKHGMKPSIIVATSKGEHHYYRLSADVKALAESHSSDLHPERIDVKTGRNPVMGPGSSNKRIVTWGAGCFEELRPASQAFLDDIRAHNGHVERVSPRDDGNAETPKIRYGLDVLGALLEFLDVDDYPIWTTAGMILHHETSGSTEGFELYDSWSSKGLKYDGRQKLENKWRSFDGGHRKPVTARTLKSLARQKGANIAKIFSRTRPVKTETDAANVQGQTEGVVSPFDAFNAVPIVAELEKEVLAEKVVFGGLVAMGEATAIYADANTGKTLIILSEIIQSIRQGLVRGEDVIYINLDDPLRGFTQKTRIAEEFEFLMLGEGCQGFSARDVIPLMKECTRTRTAKGKIVIIDTATKVVNLMNKDEARKFGEICRNFTRANGTVVILAHTNKNRSASGGAVYSGVADIKHNFDCMYIMDKVTEDEIAHTKTVKFSYEKMRTSVKSFASYRYSTAPNLSYVDRLLSVDLINPEDSGVVEEKRQDKPESACIDVVKDCIDRGITTRMKLVYEARTILGMSRGKMEKLLDRLTGTTAGHQWTFDRVGPTNAYVYRLLNSELGATTVAAPVSGFSGSPVPRPATSPAPASNQNKMANDFDYEENEEFDDVTF